MADELQVTSDLTTQFAQLGDIKTVTARLSGRLDQISAANLKAAGTDDAYAKAYHKNVDANQQNLVDLVDGIGSLFETNGENGQAVSKSFDAVEDASVTAVHRLGALQAEPAGTAFLPAASADAVRAPLTAGVTRMRATADAVREPQTTGMTRTRAIAATPATPVEDVREPLTAGTRTLGDPLAAAIPGTPAGTTSGFDALPAHTAFTPAATPLGALQEPLVARSRMLATPATPVDAARQPDGAPDAKS